jgi:hypothetical protein
MGSKWSFSPGSSSCSVRVCFFLFLMARENEYQCVCLGGAMALVCLMMLRPRHLSGALRLLPCPKVLFSRAGSFWKLMYLTHTLRAYVQI